MFIKKNVTRLLVCLLVLSMLAVPALAMPQGGQEQLELLEEIALYIDEYGLFPAGDLTLEGVTAEDLENDPDLFYEIVDSWLADDKYGYFLTAEEYEIGFGSSVTPAASGGIGIGIDTVVPTGLYVESILPGSSAEESGIVLGSQIISADGVDITDMNYMDGRLYLIGEPDTVVTVGYMNPGSTEVHYEDLERRRINVGNVTYGMIEGTDIGYISITQFDTINDALDFVDAYNVILPAAGATSVIIDLRNNLGGMVNIAFMMFDATTDEEGLLFCELIGNGKSELTSLSYYSFGWTEEDLADLQLTEGIWEPEDIVVLVNEDTASASEILAGALQAHGMAVLVGTGTRGKAHSQYHVELTTGDMLVFTMARIELHEIGFYDEIGIIPDHEVEQIATPGTELGFEEIYPDNAIFSGTKMKDRVTGLQERLRLLGYYRTEPTGVFDDYTVWALNRFQALLGLRQTPYASVPALRALDAWMELVLVYEDTQLDYGIGLCAS
ncbi:MAG: peptidoglycan-binding protein [Oscillospiraceae bacterium]|jgi:carboxyl-terminal processing protease|nr:peptidoglycan-binding protein [Oscillospiraceae bacterium]